jgi:hypothetical protein
MYQSRCKVKNSWWWAERLPETCTVIIPIKLEFSASVGFIHKEKTALLCERRQICLFFYLACLLLAISFLENSVGCQHVISVVCFILLPFIFRCNLKVSRWTSCPLIFQHNFSYYIHVVAPWYFSVISVICFYLLPHISHCYFRCMIHFDASNISVYLLFETTGSKTVLAIYVSALPVAYTFRWCAYLKTRNTSIEYS